jgi:steroid delta-isomerase-like uncharacterized protein
MRLTHIAFAFVAIGAISCTSDRSAADKQVVQRMVDAINARDFEALDAVIAPDIQRHSAATPDVTVTNREEFKEFLRQDVASVPDSRQEVLLMLAEDGLVAVRMRYSGTQQGPMGPFPATGKTFSLPFLGILRIENEQIAEMWVEWDNLGLLSQLGLFPPAEPSRTGG